MSPFSETIYGLKREYGKRITLLFNGQSEVDLVSGETTYPNQIRIDVKRAVIVPAKTGINIIRSIVLNQTQHQAGGIETADYMILLDKKDLAKNQISVDFVIIIEDKQYIITDFTIIEDAVILYSKISQGGV